LAGIGFELRKLIRGDSYLSLLQGYAYAGLISSGPWVLSITVLILIGILSVPVLSSPVGVTQFQTIITYLIALSLVATGLVQLGFCRYCADRIFQNEPFRLLPNFNGLVLLVTAVAGGLAFPLSFFLFQAQSIQFRILLPTTFVVLCNVWIAVILLSGLKAYREVLLNFAVGYGSILGLAFFLRHGGLEGLMLAFLTGQALLLTGMTRVIFASYPSPRFLEFDFLRRGRMFTSLILAGFVFNLGIWVDKLVFWFHPYTSSGVIGPLRSSEVYDLPIFLAYLAIIPGMAVFLIRMETDFVEYYNKFYDAVRAGGSLDEIYESKDEMVQIARQGIFDILKIQALAAIGVYFSGPILLRLAGISELHLPLLYIDVAGVSFQVVFLGLLNICFYLDLRQRVLLLTGLFAGLNLVLSLASIVAGPFFYGYGFAVSLIIAIMVGLILLNRDFDRLVYRTFMIR
jgi:polysaccharide biosynthesis protein PelG